MRCSGIRMEPIRSNWCRCKALALHGGGLEIRETMPDRRFTLRSDEKGLEKPCSVGSFQALICPSEYPSQSSIPIFIYHVARKR